MNNQINCEIIQDLMPLVLDDACSDGSRRAVEEHIAGCEHCAEVFSAMKSETPKPAGDENEKKHFVTAMKKTRRKTRWLKVVSLCLAALLLTAGVLAWMFPDYSARSFAPADWFHDAHLVRTQQGHLLVQFTPDARYRTYMGLAGCSIGAGVDQNNPELYSMELRFSYSTAAKVLDRAVPDTPEMVYYEGQAIKLSNGDWAVPISAYCRVYYLDGSLASMDYREPTLEELTEILKNDSVELPGWLDALRNVDPQEFYKEGEILPFLIWDRDPDTEPVSLEQFGAEIAGDGKLNYIFQPGDEIPLCSDEIELEYAAIRTMPDRGDIRSQYGP